jgi:hypothetical protein
MVALGRHYGCTVATCWPFDPEPKGGMEATVKIDKADLVPALSGFLRPRSQAGQVIDELGDAGVLLARLLREHEER